MTSTEQTATGLDHTMVRTWFDVLYVNTPGLVHISSTGNWSGRAFTDYDQATDYVTELDKAQPEGIYLRATTLKEQPGKGGRGSAADSLALPGLWADLDIAGPGHKHDVCPDDCTKGHGHITRPLPPTEADARHIITEAGLPDPTLWVHSGGGLYPWWLLDQHTDITNDNLSDLEQLSTRWQAVIGRSAAALGWHYGTGVGDLARVLRIPGTINRKAGLERPCRIIDARPERYSLDQLHAGLRDAISRHPDPQPAPPPAPRRLEVVRPAGHITPNDDFEARTGWDDPLLLGGADWTVVKGVPGSYCEWRRPGKTDPGISATTGHDPTRDRLKVFTDATEFEQGQVYTKPGAYAVLHHGGDHKAATRHLARLGYGPPTEKTDPAAEQRAAIADLLPPGQAARVLAAVDGTAARVLAEPKPEARFFGATQDGLARALVEHHGDRLRYCPQRGRWLHWTGHRWLWDEAECHRELIRTLARTLPDGEGWARFKASALSANGVTGVARLAQSDPNITVHLNDLDARPYELNTPAGTIDLRTGELQQADPAALHTRCTAVAPDFDRRSEAFERFLTDTFADADLLKYVQRLLGISTIGTVLEQLLPFGHGTGANGKSTLLEAAMHALGVGETGYAMAAPAEMLMVRRHAEHPTELAQLAGARLVVCSELDDGQRFAEARVKQLTGRDSINARFMRRDPFTFIPSHTLWLLGNHKPAARTGGPAFWRRVRLLPFTQVVPEDRRDTKLGEKLADDAPAILAWMARGAADYEQSGLREPTLVRAATDAYEADQNTVARFVEDICHVAPGNPHIRVYRDELRAAYERWCHEGGDEEVTPRTFAQQIRDLVNDDGRGKTGGRRYYTGICLLEADRDDEVPHASEWYR